MRLVLALAFILPVTLAGCGQSGGNGQNAAAQNAAGGLPTPGPRPAPAPVPAPSPGGGSSFDQGFRQSYRSTAVESCIASARTSAPEGVPAGTDFRVVCTCYVDRVMADLNTEQLTQLRPGPREQAIAARCGEEHGLRPPGGGGGK